jgi:hypothetical protein
MDHPFGLLVLPNDPPKGGFELSKMMSIHTRRPMLPLEIVAAISCPCLLRKGAPCAYYFYDAG